jgi:fructooligosaccharide transport system substrate-binding protein
MKRLLSILLALTLLLTATAAFAEASDEQTTITWLSQGVGETAWEGLTKPILERYEELTGVKVVGEFYSFNDLFDVIEVKIASGSTDYDVISVDVPMVAAYATRGYIAPMDSYFTDEEKSQFIDSAVAAGSWQGTFYAPPMNTSTQCLWYNKDLLEQAGVEIPDSSTTDRLAWEEVVDLANQVLDVVNPDRNNGIFGLDWQQVSRVYQMNAIPNSLGGANIGDDGYTVDGVINNDAWVTGMTWYQNLVNTGVASQGITADEMSNYFASGKLVFMVGGTWTASTVENLGFTDYGYAAMPAFEGHEDEVATPTGSWHFGINAASTKQDAAADFIKFMTIGEGSDMWLEINGDVPARKTKLDDIINDPTSAGYLKIGAYEAANTSVPRALTPGYSEYSTILNATWEDVRNGADVKTALDSAVEQINSAMAKYE